MRVIRSGYECLCRDSDYLIFPLTFRFQVTYQVCDEEETNKLFGSRKNLLDKLLIQFPNHYRCNLQKSLRHQFLKWVFLAYEPLK